MTFKQFIMGTAAAVVIPGSIAQAQTAQAPPGAVEEVVVTGSRVTRDGSLAPTPVTVVSVEQLQQASPGQVGEALNQLPVFRGSTRPTSGGPSAAGPNTGSFLNLRGLGAQRTLILLNGKRAAPSAIDGTTDTNIIPQGLVSRVDVVTGGASAAYGSDAVAGVVNFILDPNLRGLKGQAQFTMPEIGEGRAFKGSLSGGQSFANGAGRVIASVSYYGTEGIDSTLDTKIGRQLWGSVIDSTRPGMLIFRPNMVSANATKGGLILSAGALNLLQFSPTGELVAYDRGQNRSNLSQIGGDGAPLSVNLSAGMRNGTGFSRVEYDLSENLMVFGEAAYAYLESEYPQVQAFNLPGLNPITIFSGNAYLRPEVQQRMDAAGLASFTMGRMNYDFGDPPTAFATNRTLDLSAGFQWKANDTWVVDGYVERGTNAQTIKSRNNQDHITFYAAADAVRDPATGQIVCRVTLTNPGLYPGCVPINLFGNGSVSSAAADYVTGTSRYRADVEQVVAALTAHGELLSLPAGPVGMAFGAEYRSQEVHQVSDPVSTRRNNPVGIRGFPANLNGGLGGWILTNVQPLDGKYDIREAFGEVAVPLLRDAPLAKSLDLNAAVRYTDYSTSGAVATWKVGATWEPVDGIRLRATRSRDIRAPNINELFTVAFQASGSVNDNGVLTSIIGAATGNPDLKPEIADTVTLGAVFTPTFVSGLTVAVDYYGIEVKDVIGSLSNQQMVDQCNGGNQTACGLITRGPNGVITRITRPNLNLNYRKVSGVDMELTYRPSWDVFGGTISGRVIASYLHENVSQVPGGLRIDNANHKWRGNANVEWQRGPLSAFLQGRLIGAGLFDNTRVEGVTIEDNTLPAIVYFETTVNYRIREGVQVYGTVNNLFNKTAPLAPQGTNGYFTHSNGGLYDLVGRTYSVGVNFRF